MKCIKPKYFNCQIAIDYKVCEKRNNIIYIKHLDYTVLLIVSNSKNVIHVPIKSNIVSIFPKIIVQPIQLKRRNLHIIKKFCLNAL